MFGIPNDGEMRGGHLLYAKKVMSPTPRSLKSWNLPKFFIKDFCMNIGLAHFFEEVVLMFPPKMLLYKHGVWSICKGSSMDFCFCRFFCPLTFPVSIGNTFQKAVENCIELSILKGSYTNWRQGPGLLVLSLAKLKLVRAQPFYSWGKILSWDKSRRA